MESCHAVLIESDGLYNYDWIDVYNGRLSGSWLYMNP